MVTVAVPVRLGLVVEVAETVNEPAEPPAVNNPDVVIVPPVADQLTGVLTRVPSDMTPCAVNCFCRPTTTDAVAGETLIDCRNGAEAVALPLISETPLLVPNESITSRSTIRLSCTVGVYLWI